MSFRLGSRAIGGEHPLFVIAEVGLNHGGSVARALALVDAAADAGASAVKLQTLKADRLVAAGCPAPAHVQAGSLREFFHRFELDETAHRAIARRARARGLVLMSTPFDPGLVDLLETIGCEAFKIASGDLTFDQLIVRVARTGQPMILSTGMSTHAEIARAIGLARSAGCARIGLLHCVSAYPVPAGHENYRAITRLSEAYDVPAGLSDHGTDPLGIALAVACGAVIYERHLMLEGDTPVDADVSSTPADLTARIAAADCVRRALGDGRKTADGPEAANRLASRRSLHAVRSLGAGDVVTEDAIVALRPGGHLAPGRWRELVGRRLGRPVPAGAPFLPSDLDGPRAGWRVGLRPARRPSRGRTVGSMSEMPSGTA